jgi:hypothetical protein
MSDPIVFGFPRSTFVQIVRLVLTHKNVSYTFRDLEPEMGKPTHLGAASLQPRADPAARRFHGVRDKCDRDLC